MAMFGKKQSTESQVATASSASSNGSTSKSACVIVHGTVIEGEFYSKSDTRLDGTIKGKVTCEARLIMGKEAVVDGVVESKDAKIAGAFSGELNIQGLLSLEDSAKVEGSVKADKMEVAEGALLNGDVAIGKSQK
jgi:cytoskeletal protein CcmA (bactofilin family)